MNDTEVTQKKRIRTEQSAKLGDDVNR